MAEHKARRDGMENRIKGNAEELKGKIRGNAGDAVDSREDHVRGRAEQMKGKMRKGVGRIQQELGKEDDVDRGRRR